MPSSHIIRVSSDGRHFTRDGQPWWLCGDTAWELLHRLTIEESMDYLEKRAAQGFNVILTVALAEFGGLGVPNAEGAFPLVDQDPLRPNEPYWSHVDRVVAAANDLGITVGLLPSWGSYWYDDEVKIFTEHSMEHYGNWIARRYLEADVIWVLGGDRSLDTPERRRLVDSQAEAIRSIVGDRHLITFHPRGHESSKDSLADADWMDLDLQQSGHQGWHVPNYQLIEQDLQRSPRRPVLDGEPNYEAHPVMTPDWRAVPDCVFDDRDVRRAAYHALLAGAAGHVYGCNGIYQFLGPDEPDSVHGGRLSWREALEAPGAAQMGHLFAWLRDIHLEEYEPDQSLIARRVGFLSGHIRAMIHRDRDRALCYAPAGVAPVLDLSRLLDTRLVAQWWDPAAGQWVRSGQEFSRQAETIVQPVFEGDGVVLLGSE